jgi:DNA-binding response OmpR family regulator
MHPPTHICSDCCPRPESKFRLLYVSSDLETLASLRAVLTSAQVHIIACSDRGSAILFLKSGIPYHLMLIDLEWRGTEGLKLARLARSLRHRRRMPTLLLSATALNAPTSQLARKAGINKCVEKTQDMTEAVEAITRLVERVMDWN